MALKSKASKSKRSLHEERVKKENGRAKVKWDDWEVNLTWVHTLNCKLCAGNVINQL